MSLEQTTELYASVLHQLLPEGLHDTAQTTLVADDIYAHAKVLAQADIDAHRLLKVLEEVPPELLPEYEAEYGLPLKYSINAGRTIEERIEILRWVRSARNVLNRAYVEQLLAIFGVVLIDIVKFKPLLCTAPCNSPVNTEQLRYKVVLRLQYPVNADMGCIVENYLPGYLRFDWMIDMPWGDWILNSAVTVNTNGIAHYTAYKTNQREYYDSFADIDLTDAIIRSFHDTDMQQWQGFKEAVNSLTGVTDWIVDLANNQISYKEISDPNLVLSKYLWTCIYFSNKYPYRDSAEYAESICLLNIPEGRSFGYMSAYDFEGFYCHWSWGSDYVRKSPNPNYNPNGGVVTEKYISFSQIAEKIISNLQSSNEGTSLLAEVYLEAVANSIFNTNPSKQFVKLSDLLSQFELNKTLRT